MRPRANGKERKKAFRSALAATSQESYVNARGHTVPDKATLPYVVDNKIESIAGDAPIAFMRPSNLIIAKERERVRLKPSTGWSVSNSKWPTLSRE